MWVQSLGREDPFEKEVATHSQYSCLEKPMDRGTWRAMVHNVAKSWTRWKLLSTHTQLWLTNWALIWIPLIAEGQP